MNSNDSNNVNERKSQEDPTKSKHDDSGHIDHDIDDDDEGNEGQDIEVIEVNPDELPDGNLIFC